MNAITRAPRGGIWALVPVKAFALAKSRLQSELDAGERAAFARALFEHVLGVLAESTALGGTLVVTSCPEVAALAVARGAAVCPDAVSAGLGRIIDGGLRALAERGAVGALVVMSDLPGLTLDDIARLLDRMREGALVVAPDERRQGTNALGLCPPARMTTFFGRADSFAQHCREAEDLGLELAIVDSPGLAFDVDGPDDLRRLPGRGRLPFSPMDDSATASLAAPISTLG